MKGSSVGVTPANATQASASGAAQTLTIAAVAGKINCIRAIKLFASGAGGNATCVVQDNGVTKIDLGTIVLTNEAKHLDMGGEGFCGTPGNAVQVVVGLIAAIVTTVSVIADTF